MIEIQVGHNELVLFSDTTLNIEYNNALFSQDAMEGDIVYSFDIPIRGNERALNFEHLPYSVSHRKYDCTINVRGINIITGKLVVQKVTDKKYSVAVIVNPYPEGWKDKSVRDDGNEKIQIVSEYATFGLHNTQWLKFLKNSIDQNSDIKFGLIFNDENYGSDNEDFGFWHGGNVGGYINRLYINQNNDVVTQNSHPLVRVFNHANMFESTMENNQFAFCPQIRLKSILKKILESSQNNVYGEFFENDEIDKIFIQSQKALDGNIYQYHPADGFGVSVRGYYRPNDSDGRFSYPVFIYRYNGDWYYDVHGNESWDNGLYHYVGDRIYYATVWMSHSTTEFIPFHRISGTDININYGAISFSTPGEYTIDYSIKIPEFRTHGYQAVMPGKLFLCWGSVNTDSDVSNIISERYFGNLMNISNEIRGTFSINISQQDVASSRKVYLKMSILTNYGHYLTIPTGESTLDVRLVGECGTATTNIYAKSFDLFSCLPDVSNSEFINAIRKSLGLTYYIDHATSKIEVGFAKDLDSALSFELSKYIIDNETSIEYKGKRCVFKYDTTATNEEINSGKIIQNVSKISELPDAKENLGMYCFVEESNAYWHSEKEEDSINIWNYTWKKSIGNTESITVGNEDSVIEEIESKVKIPTNKQYYTRYIDSLEHTSIPDIPFKIESEMFTNNIGKDIILLCYRGLDQIWTRTSRLKFESMVPVKEGDFGLRVSGSNSSGKKFVKRWLEIINGNKTIKYKCYLPVLKAIELTNLLKPQNGNQKTRWIMVNNVKSMPKKISLQIDNNDGMVLCEIESVLPD